MVLWKYPIITPILLPKPRQAELDTPTKRAFNAILGHHWHSTTLRFYISQPNRPKKLKNFQTKKATMRLE